MPDEAEEEAPVMVRVFSGTHIGWFSPECTNHTNASGKKRDGDLIQPDLFNQDPPLPDEARERSRSTMWDVVRFAEFHRYPIVLVENVVEATRWAPFQAWLSAMESLGYDHEIICHNSMHAQLAGRPAPQSRDRLYVAFWLKTMRRPAWERAQRPPAWCERCDAVTESVKSWKRPGNIVGRYRAQYVYVCHACGTRVEPAWLPASSVIDWSIPGTRIGDRSKPLSVKTMARIRAALDRWGQVSPLVVRNASTRPGADAGYLATPVGEPLRTVLAGGVPQSLLTPAMLLAAHGHTYDAADPNHPQHGHSDGYMRVWPATDPLRTLTASATTGMLQLPMIMDNNHHNRARHVGEPFPTLTTATTKTLIVPVEGREGKQANPDLLPLRTLTTRNETALLVPYNGKSAAREVSEPMGTVTTVDRYGMVMLRGTNRTKALTEPLDTIAAGGIHHALTDLSGIDVEDCLFRMIEPHEYAGGMAFPDTYIWRGTKRERVKLSGNAVTPPTARDFGIIAIEALEASR